MKECDHKFIDSNNCLKCGVHVDALRRFRPASVPLWAVYYKGDDLAVVNVPHGVAMQIAKQVSHATVITMEAAARITHQHQLGATVCAKCAGEREQITI